MRAFVVLLGLGVGCDLAVDPDDCTLRCSASLECPSGYSCSLGLCAREGTSCGSVPSDPPDAGNELTDGATSEPDGATAETDGALPPDGGPGPAPEPDAYPGECTPAATQSEACSCTGTRSRTCSLAGMWGAWGGCIGGGVCEYLQTRIVECGCSGAMSQQCDASCQWQDTSSCLGGDICDADEICPAGTCCWGSGHFCSDENPGRCCTGVCNGFCT